MDQTDRPSLTDHLRETATAINRLHVEQEVTHAPGQRASRVSIARDIRLAELGAPTTADLADLADSLRLLGSMRALIVGMTVEELHKRLTLGGLEMYADCAGNTVIRTKEAGDTHRAKVAAEKQERVDNVRKWEQHYREQASAAVASAKSRPFVCANYHPECSTHVYGPCSVRP